MHSARNKATNAITHFISTSSMILALVLLGFMPIMNAQADIARVFVFGDSLSDAGNHYIENGETTKEPYPPIPSYPYAMGGHHFSNGKTWAENFAQALNDSKGAKASSAAPGENGNYAYGGARARTTGNESSPLESSNGQVGTFLADFGTAPSDALYVIQFGGNDLRDALSTLIFTQDIQAATAILNDAVASIAQTIVTLYSAGASQFLIANAPALEHAPVISGTAASLPASLLTGAFNAGLESALQTLEGANLPISLKRVDFAGFTNEVVTTPEAFGLTTVDHACLNVLLGGDMKCDNPEQYLFWDGIHPTKAGHDALAERALESIN